MLFEKCGETTGDNLVEQFYTPRNSLAVFGFCFLGETSLIYKFRKPRDVFREKHRVVKKLLVTLIAKYD